MVNGVIEGSFFDSWAWLVFVAIGLVMILLELIVGVETGLDLVFIGTAFILGGLITIPMNSWVWTAVVTGVICVLYLVIGRRFVHKRIAVAKEKTNIDAIVGKTGIVKQEVGRTNYGLVKIGMEDWRAQSEEDIKEGEEVIVTSVSGVTLNVKKTERRHK
jgi:membrane protein implicated in regulation of membrane protease activity